MGNGRLNSVGWKSWQFGLVVLYNKLNDRWQPSNANFTPVLIVSGCGYVFFAYEYEAYVSATITTLVPF